MKHLLRKLHIGGINGHPRPMDPIATTSPSPSTSIAAIDSDQMVGGDAGSNSGGGEVDFNLMEEEFQVQLALAINASNLNFDSGQGISLGYSASADGADSASSMVDSFLLRYWEIDQPTLILHIAEASSQKYPIIRSFLEACRSC